MKKIIIETHLFKFIINENGEIKQEIHTKNISGKGQKGIRVIFDETPFYYPIQNDNNAERVPKIKFKNGRTKSLKTFKISSELDNIEKDNKRIHRVINYIYK